MKSPCSRYEWSVYQDHFTRNTLEKWLLASLVACGGKPISLEKIHISRCFVSRRWWVKELALSSWTSMTKSLDKRNYTLTGPLIGAGKVISLHYWNLTIIFRILRDMIFIMVFTSWKNMENLKFSSSFSCIWKIMRILLEFCRN